MRDRLVIANVIPGTGRTYTREKYRGSSMIPPWYRVRNDRGVVRGDVHRMPCSHLWMGTKVDGDSGSFATMRAACEWVAR